MNVSTEQMTVTVEGPTPRQPQELRCANSLLGRARVARGWSQDKTVRALVLLAESWGWQVAAETSLKVQLSRWEHGASRPSETYRVLFCALYRTTPDALGFSQRRETTKDLRARISELEAAVERLTGSLVGLSGVAA
ncbi:XRE family transcriptional regulator [Streptomyces sp. NBC_00304]|uniref:XRE family transcriptional regulator n=1 Tax=Streptomyces sp. NBC_00304 TaxID=2975706 RepID=UPI002E2B38CA|nr:XRE family transcriptional regulator [Streptomyces sp. NBC_00304]